MLKHMVMVLVLALPLAAFAAPRSDATSTCAEGSRYPDGCAGAEPGSIRHANFFTSYARMSGQRPYATRPPWNVAGVDYGVGAPTNETYLDPATSPLPNGCTFNATGSASGGPIVICHGVTDVRFDGWDFSGIQGGEGCVELEIKTDVIGTVTVRNSRWVNGANCDPPAGRGYFINVDYPGKAALTLINDTFDGGAPQFNHAMRALVYDLSAGTFTSEYSAFLRAPARPVATGCSILAEYNYVEGFIYDPAQGHGEWIISGDACPSPIASWQYSYNTILQPSSVTAGSTTTIYLALSIPSLAVTSAQVDHNTTVTNYSSGVAGGYVVGSIEGTTLTIVNRNGVRLGVGNVVLGEGVTKSPATIITSGDGLSWTVNNAQTVRRETLWISGLTTAASAAEVGHSTFGNITFIDNYTDPTGSLYMFAARSSPVCQSRTVFKGNINLLTGAAIDGFAPGAC